MKAKTTPANSEKVIEAPAVPTDFDAFFARLGDRDRRGVVRHVTQCEAEPTDVHVKLWKRLACFLAALTPHAIQISGACAVQYYIPDGKYRRQIFALEDLRDGIIKIYMRNAPPIALRQKLLTGKLGAEGSTTQYPIRGAADQTLEIESLTEAGTVEAPDYYRHMLGWRRKAVCVRLPINATAAQVEAVEALCRLVGPEYNDE